MSGDTYKKEKINDNVHHPLYYQAEGLECIDVMEKLFGIDWVYHFCVLNSFKYQWRCNNKRKTEEDLRKAIWYNQKAIELLEKIKEQQKKDFE